MSLVLSIRRARLQLVRDAIDVSGGGTLQVFGGVQPSTGGAPDSSPLLIVALGVVSFEMDATDALMSMSLEVNVAVTGLPTWARFSDGAGDAVMDLVAGMAGSGAPVTITDGQDPPSSQMYSGGVVSVNCVIDEYEA